MNKCIIIANGKTPQKNIISFLKSKGYSTIICADGGANSARKLSIIPDYIIGDLDSINGETLQFFTGKSKIIKFKRQNDTDVEKCLKFAIKKKCKDCVLLGVTGDRLDHSFCNLGITIKFSEFLSLKMISEKSILSVFEGEVKIKTYPGEIISIYAFDEKTKITSSGLKYKLNNTILPFGKKESTSNEAVKNEITLKISGGKIFLIRDYKIMKRYDLF